MRIIFSMLMVMQLNAMGQNKLPLEVVQQQLDAYNRQDVDAFAAVFSTDVQLFNKLGDSLPAMVGRTAIASRYAAIFKQYPKNKSTLLGRMLQGEMVIDHELITGREQQLKIIAVYEVQNGLITRCWFIR